MICKEKKIGPKKRKCDIFGFIFYFDGIAVVGGKLSV